MSHGIERQTYIDADEKTTKALTYDLLNQLYSLAEQTGLTHTSHVEHCDKRFRVIEDRKKRDTTTASIFGILGGFIAMLLYYLKNWLER